VVMPRAEDTRTSLWQKCVGQRPGLDFEILYLARFLISDLKSPSVRYIKSTGEGGTHVQLQLDGAALGELLGEMLIPEWLAVAVPLLATAVAWIPTLMLMLCVYSCCCAR
jgi:hypothetical protein